MKKTKQAIRLGPAQLRAIIKEELSRVTEAGKFELTDVSQHVSEDNELMDAIGTLCEQMAYAADKLAKKEGLIGDDDHAFIDAALENADSTVRDCVYEFIKNALAMAGEVG